MAISIALRTTNKFFFFFFLKKKKKQRVCNSEAQLVAGKSTPKSLIFDRATALFSNAASLQIKCPLLKCTIEEIIIPSMNR
jgi:hypothetical protein